MTHDQDFTDEPLLADELRTMRAGLGAPYVFQTEALAARIERTIDTQTQRGPNGEQLHLGTSRPSLRLADSIVQRPRWQGVWRQPSAVMALLLAVVVVIIGGVRLLQSLPQVSSHVATTYTTARGERARVTLTDGTTVLLNVASRLEVPDNFGRNHRTVRLTGEAYFQVAHVAGTPFIVNAHDAHLQVLGTAFGVHAYGPAVQVAIRSGKVSLNNVILTAGDIADMVPGRDIQVSHAQHLDAALGFVTGRLVLADVSLQEAINELNRWYDADIRLSEPSLGTTRMHAVLTSGSIGDLMEVLRTVFDLRVVRDGRTLTLFPR